MLRSLLPVPHPLSFQQQELGGVGGLQVCHYNLHMASYDNRISHMTSFQAAKTKPQLSCQSKSLLYGLFLKFFALLHPMFSVAD